MADLKFGNSLTFPPGPMHDYAVSPDGKAITVTFSGLQVIADDGRSDEGAPRGEPTDPVVTRVFSMVIPVTNGSPTEAAFHFQGFALTNEGGHATLIVIINGQSTIFDFAKNSDESYVRSVKFSEPAATEIRLTVVVIAERDKQFPGAGAHLNVVSIDTDVASAQKKAASRKAKW